MRKNYKATTLCELRSAIADRARDFLATLTDLSVAESRRASELRHRLRESGSVPTSFACSDDLCALEEALMFVAGLHPERAGQRGIVQQLQLALPRVRKASGG